jgi:hypothetical protein
VYAEDRDAPDEGTRGEAGSVGRQEGYGFVGDTSEELAALATQLVLQRQAVATSGADPPPPRERERRDELPSGVGQGRYSDAKVVNRNDRAWPCLAWGDREWSLNDGQIPYFRVVRVALGMGYNRVEGTRWTSRNGLVSDLPP